MFVRQIEARLAAHNSPYAVKAVVVEGAGHAISPYLPPPVRVAGPLVGDGSREANLRLAREASAAMLAFVGSR